MFKPEDFKPLVSELVDSLNQQKSVARNLLEGSKQFDKEGKIIKAWETYLEKLEEQDEFIFKVSRAMEVEFENDLYKKMVVKQ